MKRLLIALAGLSTVLAAGDLPRGQLKQPFKPNTHRETGPMTTRSLLSRHTGCTSAGRRPRPPCSPASLSRDRPSTC